MATIHHLQVNAIYLSSPEQVIGQDIRFENIPWMNTEKNVFENPNTPLETNSIIPRPFSYDNAIYLEEGVHIHFILPSYFKSFGGEKKEGSPSVSNKELPLAPNRWYIKNERSGKEWIIESDYIWNVNNPLLDKHATCTYVEGEAGKDFNFHYVGRKYNFNEWINREKHTEYIKKLTALGWGSLTFDMHYPNCRSIFGFHDIDGKIDDTYSIVGWRNDESTEVITAGRFKLIETNDSSNLPIKEDFKVSIANTLPEALAALILEDDDLKKESFTQKLTLEEQMEALLNFDTLNDQKLDLISRLRHNLHEKQFYQTKGITKWQFKEFDVDSKIEQKLQELYLSHTDSLKALNENQKQYNLDSFKFYSLLESLYLDWSNYLQELYVENKNRRNINEDLSALKVKYEALIRFQNQLELENNHISSQKLAIDNSLKNYQDDKQLIEEIAYFVLEIEKGSTDLNKLKLKIEETSDKISIAIKAIQLEQVNDINFEHVLPLTVVISSHKKILDNIIHIPSYDLKSPSKFDFEEQKILDTINLIFKEYPNLPHIVKCNSWNIYKIQWHTKFLPKKEGYYLENNKNEFQSNFINSSYQLDEQNADLIKSDEQAVISYSNHENNYYGEAFIEDSVKKYLIKKIKNSLQSKDKALEPLREKLEEYRKKLKTLNVVTLSLSDLNNLMTQRSTALSVLPLIPNGFQNHQKLADNLNILFNKQKENINLFSPNRLSTFNPLRNGAMKIAKLRMIDSFGRVQILEPSKVITTKQQTIKGKEDWINLPPRLMQPAALNLEVITTNTNQIKNPVIGYLLPSYLNQHLQFFDAFGDYLGAINEEGKWEPSPFDVFKALNGKKSYKDCGNDELVAAIDWFLVHSKNDTFRSRIIQEIQTNLVHVQPEVYQNPSLLETISSVPLAITKISYELYTKGGLRYDIAKAKDITFNHAPYQNDLKSIQFPIRFGDINQYNDGLIGYWHGLNTKDTLYINSETVRTFSNEIEIIMAIKELKAVKIDKILTIRNSIEDLLSYYNSFYFKYIINWYSPELDNFIKYLEQLIRILDFKSFKKLLDDSKNFKYSSLDEALNSLLPPVIYDNIVKKLNPILADLEVQKSIDSIFSILQTISKIDDNILKDNPILNISVLKDVSIKSIDYKDLYDSKIDDILLLIEELKLSNNDSDNIFDFLLEIMDNRGYITKADFLKHFIEHGNAIWTSLQKIGLISVDETKIEQDITINKEKVHVTAIATKNFDNNNNLLLNGEPKFIYALMHPKSKIFFKTGVLPQKHIELSYNDIKHALKKIELTLLTSPILTPKEDLQISLAQDTRYKWSWIELKKAKNGEELSTSNKPLKKRIPQELTIDLSVDTTKYSELEAYIDTELEDFFPKEHIYYLRSDTYNKLLQNLEKEIIQDDKINDKKVSKEQREKDLAILKLINQYKIQNINSFNTSISTIPTLVLKEGWLSIKPTKK